MVLCRSARFSKPPRKLETGINIRGVMLRVTEEAKSPFVGSRPGIVVANRFGWLLTCRGEKMTLFAEPWTTSGDALAKQSSFLSPYDSSPLLHPKIKVEQLELDENKEVS